MMRFWKPSSEISHEQIRLLPPALKPLLKSKIKELRCQSPFMRLFKSNEFDKLPGIQKAEDEIIMNYRLKIGDYDRQHSGN